MYVAGVYVVNNFGQKSKSYCYNSYLFMMTFWSQSGNSRHVVNPEIPGLGKPNPGISELKLRPGCRRERKCAENYNK